MEQNVRLKQSRLDLGWSQDRLAREVGCTLPTIKAWEGGRRSPGRENRQKLATALGKTQGWLFREEEELESDSIRLSNRHKSRQLQRSHQELKRAYGMLKNVQKVIEEALADTERILKSQDALGDNEHV